jgi:hypothetical protein
VVLAAYSTEHDILELTANQLNLINKLVIVLSHIEEITQCISCENSSATVIIPFVRALREHLEKIEKFGPEIGCTSRFFKEKPGELNLPIWISILWHSSITFVLSARKMK